MRKRILELLRNSGGEPVSGEEISRQLEVSRTAIWKHIQALKNDGCGKEDHSALVRYYEKISAVSVEKKD